MDSNPIVIIGSTNMDMVVKTSHIPTPGETVLGGKFLMNPGGKGANQAVAVARLGGKASFISKVGNDIFGNQSLQLFVEEGIDTQFLLQDNQLPSGVALITVDDSGENSIVVAPGANAGLTRDNLEPSLEKIVDPGFYLMQLEVPIDTIKFALQYARQRGIKTILNPAPADPGITDLLDMVDYITPNSSEAEILTGIPITDMEQAKLAAAALHRLGSKHVIITLGEQGAIISGGDSIEHIPATPVKSVDSTAAGDTFNGALAVALAEGEDLPAAVKFACNAAAITVTRLGAQNSIPTRKELDQIRQD